MSTSIKLSSYKKGESFIIFITLHIFYLSDEKSFPFSYNDCYWFWSGIFSFCPRYGRSFTGYCGVVYSTVFLSFQFCVAIDPCLIILFTIGGIWSSNKLEPFWGEDPSRVVVDEMVGVWIALLAAPEGNFWYPVAAFALFRLFDIFKPLGIRKMESLKGGVGVMMDDILAGIYSFILLAGVRWLIG